MMHPDHRVEGEECPDCGRMWGYRQGDGGREGGILSIYHLPNCPHAPKQGVAGTEEASDKSGTRMVLVARIKANGNNEADLEMLRGDLLPPGVPIELFTPVKTETK